MNYYLYTWNPKRWNWEHLQLAIDDMAGGQPYADRWSCGNTRKIVKGDFFFLIRLGVDPKGIVGCGYVVSDTYEDKHWDDQKAAEGVPAIRTDIMFTTLSIAPLISLEVLQHRHPEFNWTPKNGGRQIPESIATNLLEMIQAEQPENLITPSAHGGAMFLEGAVKTVTIKTYDRSPAARQACIDHYGYKCVACGFDFEEAYGVIGRRYIQVHHVIQLADIKAEYKIDPINDLRPVCANCHVMLHRTRPAMPVHELTQILRK